MTLLQWWMIPVWVVLVALAVLAAWLLRRRAGERPVPVAHVERLTELPRYRRVLRRYRALVAGFAVLLVVGFVSAAALTTRPATTHLERTDLATRDIVLCLDVSGSMVDYDAQVVDVFSELAKRFDGERLSLVVFNASAVTYFPLTTDLDYIESQFTRISTEFASPDGDYFAGTLFGDGSSLVGDGLASCATRFPDDTDGARSRSIIFVTDNLVAGNEVYSLPEAGELARSRAVHVYGINPGDNAAKDYLSDLADQFKSVVLSTGGGYFALDDPSAIPSIVSRIEAEQASLTSGPTRVVYDDRTTLAIWLLVIAVAGLIGIGWAVRR